MKKKPKQEDEYFEPNYLMIGAYGGYVPKPIRDKKIKPQIGFIRQKVKVVRGKK